MTQKVIKIGSSVGATFPKKVIKELGIKAGGEVSVRIDMDTKEIIFKSAGAIKKVENSHQEKVASLALNFINRYRDDLNSLANK